MTDKLQQLKDWAKTYISDRVFNGKRPISKARVGILRADFKEKYPEEYQRMIERSQSKVYMHDATESMEYENEDLFPFDEEPH